MKRTTIKIPEDLDARLRLEAERRGVTISTVTREALTAYLGGGAMPRRRLRFIEEAEASGYTDTAERAEELLREGFGESSLAPEQRR